MRQRCVWWKKRYGCVWTSGSDRPPGEAEIFFDLDRRPTIMAATVLNGPRAVFMSVYVVRAFVRMRETLLGRAGMEKRLAEIERTLVGHDAGLKDLYRKLKPLLLPSPAPPRREIGFHAKD